jgi:dihydropteroate synthase
MPYFRPLVQHGAVRPECAVSLAGGALWFTHAVRLERGGPSEIVATSDIPTSVLERLTLPRTGFAGLSMSEPQLMGILNVTPDSFSDGGRHNDPVSAVRTAMEMVRQGASIIDIGGESTRPGAVLVEESEEIHRTAPVIARIRAETPVAMSIDTRKQSVAQAALMAGADIVNDVSGFTYDSALASFCAESNAPVCIMHSKGDPETMQNDPVYDNVLLDVYDFLEGQIATLVQAGVPRSRIMVDPGIGFAKTQGHNLTILQNISLFHGLGCAILLGASRKRFIGTIGEEPSAEARAPGSIAVALAALAQGVQVIRVHDVAETAQAVRLWRAVQ